MCLQVPFLCKCFGTETTLVRLFLRMNPKMSLQCTSGCKLLLTVVAHVRFLSCMYAHVTCETSRAGTGKGTHLTYVWFFSCVDPPMPLKAMVRHKCHGAELTLMRLLSSAVFYMVDHQVSCIESLSTELTLQEVYVTMCLHVRRQLGFPGKVAFWLALVTRKRLHPAVNQIVALQHFTCREDFITQFTLMDDVAMFTSQVFL